MSTSNATDADLVSELAAAERDLEAARERVGEFGEADLERLADAYEEFTGLLDRYEEPATGDGDFKTFIEFQGNVETFVERLPEDLLLREAFEEGDDHLQQRRLTESDFEHVREQLEPVADLVARLEERQQALERSRRTRKRIQGRLRDLEDRIDALERLERLGEADLDAPTERLRDPIETYNEAVRERFREFLQEAPARDVLDFQARAASVPLVDVRDPPAELAAFVETHDAGTETVEQLLSYADYSRSKLDHYVADPDALKRTVGGRQTYLQRLGADPLTVAWPPPPADELRYRCRELTGLVDRLAPSIVEDLRAVAALPRETDYERLRESAVARAELDDDERERVRSGAVSAELASAREESERLRDTLAEHPDR